MADSVSSNASTGVTSGGSFMNRKTSEVRRSRSFDLLRDDQHEHSHSSAGGGGDDEEELVRSYHEDEDTREAVAVGHRYMVENIRRRRSSGGGITDALSLELPRYDDDTVSEGGGVQNYTRRRVRSFDNTDQSNWSFSGGELPPIRSRTYTKSLGNLVKHLATVERDPMAAAAAAAAACSLPPCPSPSMSPMAKMMGALPKIWSPRSESGVASEAVVDHPIKYEFALILHNKPTTPRILARNGLDAVGKQQLEIIKRCIAAGLDVSVLSSSLYSRKYMVLLLRPTPSRLQIEKSRLVLERWLQIGAVGEVPSEIEQLIASSHIGGLHRSESMYYGGEMYSDDPTDKHHHQTTGTGGKQQIDGGDAKFTPAERLQTIARIITSTSSIEQLNPPGAGISLDDLNRKDPIIYACFPLHNRRVNNMILAKCSQWAWKSDEITNEIRFYYGERVAFYFSFVFVYTKCLVIPAISGSALYFSLRWLGAVEYMRGLCIFGFCTATIWGTFFLKVWARKNNLLNDAWNLRLFKEAEYPNATFRPHGYRDVVDSQGALLFREPYYNALYRIPAYLQTFVVFAIFIATYIIGITFFVQWYTAAMMAPLCSKCPQCKTFLSCFDTEGPKLFSLRWGYILVQGVILGVSLDVFVYLLSVKLIHFFIVRENHATERQFQRTMINRLFTINWISFFLWFILIAYVIVPFGEQVETWLATNFKYTKLTVDWENGVIDMSTALVTPLLITQALNLLIDTALPHALRKETMKASKMARKIMRANPAETLLALSEYQSSFENFHMENNNTSTNNGQAVPGSIDFKAKIELQMMTPIRIPYIERELGVSIGTLEGFENEKFFMTADDVLEESQLDLYTPFADYLRMVIQYGYVVMFSVVWPFCALAALVNNTIHIQNCFTRLLLLRRRPVPRKANTIGQWEKMLFVTLLLAVFMVVGLICVSSGELEYFLTQCTSLERFNGKDFSMNPDFSCVDLRSRFLVALVLEHVAILIVFLMMDNISDTPASVRTSFQRKKELIRRAICGHGKNAASSVPPTPSSMMGTLSYETV